MVTKDKMRTIDIKGKQYVEVNERIKFFRENYKDWSLTSKIISLEDGVCVIKAIVKDENGVTKATGLAYERENSTFINKTSYIENCETSAWGRALGNLGIVIDVSIASADEVQNAQLNQNGNSKESGSAAPTEKQLGFLKQLLKEAGKTDIEVENVIKMCKTSTTASQWIKKLKERLDDEEAKDGIDS